MSVNENLINVSEESDFDHMPAVLLFPSLAWLLDKVCCRKVSTREQFYMKELPSLRRQRDEEVVIDQYLSANGIVVEEYSILNDCDDLSDFNKRLYKPHDRLGFGTLAIFRSMRFLAAVLASMSVIMVLAGYANSKGEEQRPGYKRLDKLSLANIDYSTPICF
jgi:hypothetical protein